MSDEFKESVELEVRRILSAEELEVRRSIADEINAHRQFLQSQFRILTWGLGILFLVGGAIFTYLLGNSFKSAQERIVREVDNKVIEYRIVEAYKKNLKEQFNIIATGDAITKNIEDTVREIAAREVSDKVSAIIAENVTEELKKVKRKDLEGLIKKSNDDLRRMLADNSKKILALKTELDKLKEESAKISDLRWSGTVGDIEAAALAPGQTATILIDPDVESNFFDYEEVLIKPKKKP